MVAIVLFLVGGISWAIWTVFHAELTSALRWIRVGEMHLASLFVEDSYRVNYRGSQNTLGQWKNYLPDARVEDITYDHIKVMTYLTMRPLRLFFVVLLGLMSLWCLLYGPGSSFKRRMGLSDLMKEQAKMFPVISPFVNFDPGKMKHRAPGDPVPATLPVFAEALTPEEWVAYHQIPYVNGKLDAGKAYQALGRQLGPRWRGPLEMPIHAQALYAAFALKHVRKRTDCDDLLNEMAKAWSPEKGFRPSSKLKNRIRKTIKDPKIGGKLSKHVNKHAYQTTALLKALQMARSEGGVLAPATFVWLRGHDRNLWYPLNNLGRQAFHAEAAGALTHFVHENIAGQRIPAPRFEDVVKNIEDWLSGPSSRPIPKLEK